MQLFDGREGLRRSSSYLPELESLRGWAILLVIAFHYFGMLSPGKVGTGPGAPFWMMMIAAGNTGVTLFFVLSGFLLIRPFIENARKGRPISVRRFYGARLLRIVPLYYIVVLLAWVVTHRPETPKALLFVPIGFSAFPFSPPWWSLSVEMQFYLLLPWMMFLVHSRAGLWALAAALLAWAAAHVYFLHQPGWFELSRWQNSLFDRGFAFVAGGLAARAYLSAGFSRFAASRIAVTVELALSLLLLVLLFRWYAIVGQTQATIDVPMYHNYEAILWAAVVLGSIALAARWKLLLINPVMDHFGRISYSLYLAHVPVLFYLLFPLIHDGATVDLWQPRSLLRIGGSFLLAWGIAVIGYQWIERPFLRLKSHLPVSA